MFVHIDLYFLALCTCVGVLGWYFYMRICKLILLKIILLEIVFLFFFFIEVVGLSSFVLSNFELIIAMTYSLSCNYLKDRE